MKFAGIKKTLSGTYCKRACRFQPIFKTLTKSIPELIDENNDMNEHLRFVTSLDWKSEGLKSFEDSLNCLKGNISADTK